MPKNRVSAVLARTDLDAVVKMIDDIKSRLPFLISLTEADKTALPRFGDKSLAFVKKALALAKKDSDFLPRSFNAAEMEKDVTLYESLYAILQPLNLLVEKVTDTFRETGAEAYSAALVVYASAKQEGKNAGGLESVMDEMSRRFARRMTEKARA
jgi:hypothetical protein